MNNKGTVWFYSIEVTVYKNNRIKVRRGELKGYYCYIFKAYMKR